MEKAIYIRTVEQLNLVKDDYTRIYFGSEFCERSTPTWSQIELVGQFCASNGYDFSFVTTYFSDDGLLKMKDILGKLNQLGMDIEVIINDWGLMYHLIKNKESCNRLQPVIGRLLNKLPRDPRIKNIYYDLDEIQRDVFGKTSICLE